MEQKPGPRFHLLRRDGQNIVFDCHTFATFLVDDLAYNVLSVYERERGDCQAVQREIGSQHGEEAVRDVLEEIEALRADGYLVNNDALPSAPRTDSERMKRLKSSGITLMVAQSCNLCCTYCYSDVGTYNKYPALMSVEVARQAVDFLVDRSGGVEWCKVTFFGGEPLLNFELIQEVVAYCDAITRSGGANFFFTVTTNGTLLTDESLTFLCKHDIDIILSLDGPPEVHDAGRRFPDGRGSFDCVVEAARRIKGCGRPLRVRATLTHSSPSLPHLIQFFEHEVGADDIVFSPVMDVSDSEASSLSRNGLCNLLVQQVEIGEQNLWRFVEREAVPYNPLLVPLGRLHHRRGAVFACDAGKGMSAVATDGDIYPCHRFVGLEAFVIGDVKTGIYPEKLAAFFNNFDDALKECQLCWAYYLCAGGCPRRRALHDGTFAPPDRERCDYYRHFYETTIGMYAVLHKNHPSLFERELLAQYPVTSLPFV